MTLRVFLSVPREMQFFWIPLSITDTSHVCNRSPLFLVICEDGLVKLSNLVSSCV